MNALLKHSILSLAALLLLGIWACDKEDTNVSVGDPAVRYIRSTDPAKGDSLLTGSFMGSLIAIVGNDLASVRELWFNDQRAELTPTYITNQTIIVNVPSTVPSTVTDKMRFVFSDGRELLYDFKVNVPAPIISSIKCEYVPDGGTVVLDGDFFFEPKVTFNDLEAVVTKVEKTHLEVTVPAGTTPGPITIKTNFGKVKSRFLFRDNRNIILDYDTKLHETWTAPIGDNQPEGCAGKYAYFKSASDGAWQWANELTMQYWAPRGRGNVPVATGLLSDLTLKFEANVPEEWRDVRMEIFFAPFAEDHGRDVPSTVFARWRPWKNGPYKTDGWVTVSIPLTEFKYGKDDPDTDELGSRKIENLSSLTNITMMLFGPAAGPNPVHIAIDNVRVVPN